MWKRYFGTQFMCSGIDVFYVHSVDTVVTTHVKPANPTSKFGSVLYTLLVCMTLDIELKREKNLTMSTQAAHH